MVECRYETDSAREGVNLRARGTERTDLPMQDQPTTAQPSVSKSLRFDIFRRDSFTCLYCGRRPPDVVLELDHVHPVSKGGTNDELNLVTSCYDCNRGKAAKDLGAVVPRPDADLMFLEVQQELAEMRRYQEAQAIRERALAEIIKLDNAIFLSGLGAGTK